MRNVPRCVFSHLFEGKVSQSNIKGVDLQKLAYLALL